MSTLIKSYYDDGDLRKWGRVNRDNVRMIELQFVTHLRIGASVLYTA